MEALSISIQNLTFTYPDGTEALKGVDFNVMAGASVGLIGPNGAGKSTLLLQLNGVLTGEGTVKIGELPVAKKTLQEIRRRVGLVFQEADDQLFMPTVFDDVAFGPLNLGCTESEVKERVTKSLAAVRLSDLGEKAPHHLSGGQKRLAAIATVLSMDPGVLVLDEPTSNLDHRSRRALIDVLNDLPITKIISGHDLEFIIETCKETCLMDDGVMVKHGPAEPILSDEALLSAHGLETPHSLLHRRQEHTHEQG
ncbi:MAG: ABC transporter ATP-binding protein [Planctomycetes bacterium]|nr:ABC transporter ATP-binding protein [Planctomycetota bacterium]